MPTTQTHSRLSSPDFIGLAGHPVRWGLLTELARSDRHVNELTALARPAAGAGVVPPRSPPRRRARVVAAKRGRRAGQLLQHRPHALRRCARRNRLGAASRHWRCASFRRRRRSADEQPAQRPVRCAPATALDRRSPRRCCSTRRATASRWSAAEAIPSPFTRTPFECSRERGIDISGRTSKPLTQFDDQHFDFVVTLCDKVREACPDFSTRAEAIHWSIADPSTAAAETARPIRCSVTSPRELEHARRVPARI